MTRVLTETEACRPGPGRDPRSDNPLLRYNRAFVLRARGQWNAARADLDTAALLAPDDEDVLAARKDRLAKVTT
ncbi:tetratricopeptide repeat protein [Actinocrispum wychmicini]|uniref:Tetratricopeptide repeat protein n=1 Tax=Actinocrispum wychmicini TaxID=1213861 RepID=A0A4R2JZI2_9PSEU|nr:tetratricopeptide repeat protein [Actinocrispum wychmicini]TCO62858.1 hypothetical protein EV192_102997 [Actinocrispum wychmicini]